MGAARLLPHPPSDCLDSRRRSPVDTLPPPARANASLVRGSSRRPARPKVALPHRPRAARDRAPYCQPRSIPTNTTNHHPQHSPDITHQAELGKEAGTHHRLTPAPTQPPPYAPRPTPPCPLQPGTTRPPPPAAAPCARTSASQRPTPVPRTQSQIILWSVTTH